jgi:copper(I)-binding protein
MAVLTVAGALALAPALSACGAGETPQTAKPTQLTEGVNIQIPTDVTKPAQVTIRNLFVLGPPNGALPAGSSAPVYALLIDGSGQSDQLVSVTSPSFSGGSTVAGGGISLPAGQLVSLNQQGFPAAYLKGLTQPLLSGGNVKLTLNFANAGSVTADVPVLAQSGDYATYNPAPAQVTATPTPSTSPSPSTSPKAAKSTKTTASPTP